MMFVRLVRYDTPERMSRSVFRGIAAQMEELPATLPLNIFWAPSEQTFVITIH